MKRCARAVAMGLIAVAVCYMANACAFVVLGATINGRVVEQSPGEVSSGWCEIRAALVVDEESNFHRHPMVALAFLVICFGLLVGELRSHQSELMTWLLVLPIAVFMCKAVEIMRFQGTRAWIHVGSGDEGWSLGTGELMLVAWSCWALAVAFLRLRANVRSPR